MQNIKDILKKYDKSGPRYTSYPPATYFSKTFNTQMYQECLKESNNVEPSGISIYIHIPFCNEKCFFCGCNAFLRKKSSIEERYVNAIITEIDTTSSLLNNDRQVIQIHWGGGTPNALPFALIKKIMDKLRDRFKLSDSCEIAMECNPADLDDEKIMKLVQMGFNRISLGIQDLRTDVLKIVNRRPSLIPANTLVHKLRTAGISNVNIDLIYGLPLQTVESFNNTIEKIIEISPDRLVTFSYAHVPWVMKAQKVLEKYGLPSADEKLSMLLNAQKKLSTKGYIAIGMDHYAKPEDSLSKALKNKTLHRNFQGYCTKETTGQVYAFGCSGITQLTNAYSQNEKDPIKYIELIENTGFAVVRGYKLTKDERICRSVINEIMCNLCIDFNTIAQEYEVDVEYVKSIVEYNPEKLRDFIEDNLIVINDNVINIKSTGAFVVRNIAMCFDPKLKNDLAQYSRTV